MRTTQNPFKEKNVVEPPAAITVCLLVCMPELSGYFERSMESLQLCLTSLIHNTKRDFDLVVMDNGSCREVTDYLQQECTKGVIDYLILSVRNIGKPNAQRQLLRFAAGDVVFYADSDIYFRPGWMEAELEVLKTFPRVGLVGGQPVRDLADFHTSQTIRWAQTADVARYEVGQFIPDEWNREYSISFGRDEQWAAQQFALQKDHRVTVGGVTAYVGVAHQQFGIPRSTIETIPFERFDSAICRGDDKLNEAVDNSGLLQLSTDRPYVYHIGNEIIEPWLREEYNRLVPAK